MEREIIFISHSSADVDFSKRLATDLTKGGARAWLDVLDIEPDSDWGLSIQEALARCSNLLVVWSKMSVVSSEVLAEVFEAKANGKQILQVFIDDCKRPAQLDRLQNVDFRTNYDDALRRLIDFLPITRRRQRLKELELVLPPNPFPTIPGMTLQ
jgi:hypothetical protein